MKRTMKPALSNLALLVFASALGCSGAESEEDATGPASSVPEGAAPQVTAPPTPTTPEVSASAPNDVSPTPTTIDSETPMPAAPEPAAPMPSTPADPTPPLMGGDTTALLGFAAVPGHGVDTTTGGAGGEEVTVTTFAELLAAVADDTPRIVYVAGTITDTSAVMVDVGSNKSIIGTAEGATIDGFGFDINGWGAEELASFDTEDCGPEHLAEFTPASNVIIQNLRFKNAADDSINVQCYTHHVWIDHNTFESASDGSIDVKRGSDLVTVSWNHFDATDKTMLLGHSEDNGDQDRGYLRASYHHNWFDNTATRTPRVRFGYAHVWNNRVLTSDYFLGLGVEAHIYAEGNYVEAAKTLTQTFTESVGYNLTWTETNHFDEATITRAQDMQAVRVDWLDDNGSVVAPSEYQYPLEDAATIADVVPAGAGVGKL